MDAGSLWLKEDRRVPGFRPSARFDAAPAELHLRPVASPATAALQRMVAAVCTDKQKALLAALAERSLPPTRAIRIVSRQLDCAESSVWSALAKLKELGLVVPAGPSLALSVAAKEAFA